MARLGVLKPLRGTESSLANIVLEDGEIAFSYPSTGPGTGLGGIKMGDGVKTFSSLPWYITGEGSGPTPTPWEYDEGTNEAALLNNLKHPEYETIGKIYYIRSYWNNSSIHTTGTPSIIDRMPYIVIDINHDNTENTMDLQSMVATNYLPWITTAGYSWTSGRYTTSQFYSWGSTCYNGYSANIKAKMCNMTERWREATGNSTGTLQTRTTNVKLLNPYEIFGSSVTSYKFGTVGVSSQDFISYNYGNHYSIFTLTTSQDTTKIRYHDVSCNTPCRWWNNSFGTYFSTNTLHNTYNYMVEYDGTGEMVYGTDTNKYGICPVIRLSDIPS